jgi:predicted RNase H-like HicB family nuclease
MTQGMSSRTSSRAVLRSKEAIVVDRIGEDNVSAPAWEQVRRYAMVIEWSDADQCFLVSIPDFPGAHTHGETRAEAAAMGEEVIALLLAGERNPPPPRFTAMAYPVRPEAEVRDFAGVGKSS